MQIAIASGKGGTGKTTIATGLAYALSKNHSVCFKDCDVEAPNGHIFLKPPIDKKKEAVIQIPHIDVNKCSACGKCVDVCQFHALAQIGSSIMVFPQLCHGCGSCTWNCPENAIVEKPNTIGILESGCTDGGIQFSHGVLTISEPMSTPVIRQLKRWQKPVEDVITFLDAPPGASCSVVETLRGSDFVILVTEPTPFGIHDLRQMAGIIQDMRIKAGVIINRAKEEYAPLQEYCLKAKLPILMQIPFSREIAAGIAQGRLLTSIKPEYERLFSNMFDEIISSVSQRE